MKEGYDQTDRANSALRALRSRGLDYDDLARAAGRSTAHVRMCCQGRRPPSQAIVSALAELLDIADEQAWALFPLVRRYEGSELQQAMTSAGVSLSAAARQFGMSRGSLERAVFSNGRGDERVIAELERLTGAPRELLGIGAR